MDPEKKNFEKPAFPEKDSKETLEVKEEKEVRVSPEHKKMILEKLEREIEMMRKDPDLLKEAEKKAQEIKEIGEEKKLKELVLLAQKKGLFFAVEVAKDMKDPYTLDLFHDILAREGFYKEFEE